RRLRPGRPHRPGPGCCTRPATGRWPRVAGGARQAFSTGHRPTDPETSEVDPGEPGDTGDSRRLLDVDVATSVTRDQQGVALSITAAARPQHRPTVAGEIEPGGAEAVLEILEAEGGVLRDPGPSAAVDAPDQHIAAASGGEDREGEAIDPGQVAHLGLGVTGG